jgi:succinate-acetate transporter protein
MIDLGSIHITFSSLAVLLVVLAAGTVAKSCRVSLAQGYV